jgi:predicted glycoside hydrolase/deacetylase ChbG (UPF0249 family)
MAGLNKSYTNRMLGYPVDARLLIINADDFGMCNSVNEAIFRTLKEGVVRSTTLMVPCPWALHAMHFLADHPNIPFGVHLTVICDSDDYSWGPVTSKDKVPDLVDQAGHFYSFAAFHKLLNKDILEQLEVEFRSQIEAVLSGGFKPAHLDWHALRIGGRTDIFDLMIRLAKEYGLALRVMGRELIEKVQSQGLPANDYDFLDSYLLDPVNKSARYAQLLRELPTGLSEWGVHPGLDNAELLALEPAGNHERQTDFDFWTSQQAKDIIREEGIILVDYRALQVVWNKVSS